MLGLCASIVKLLPIACTNGEKAATGKFEDSSHSPTAPAVVSPSAARHEAPPSRRPVTRVFTTSPFRFSTGINDAAVDSGGATGGLCAMNATTTDWCIATVSCRETTVRRTGARPQIRLCVSVQTVPLKGRLRKEKNQ